MIIPVLLLLSLGIAVIFTSSQTLAIYQTIFAVTGLILYFVISKIDFNVLSKLIKFFYIIILGLLIFTFILGFETRGSIRWIPLGPFNFQPSEFAKPVLILTLAYFWSRHSATWVNILKSLGVLLPIAFLVFRQPDLGTTLTIVFIWFSLLIAANISLIKSLALGFLGLILTPFIWFNLEAYQKQRIFSYLTPASDPQGIGFHVIQSTIAVGSGQFFGRGLGLGTQSRLQFLPEFRTDFIFAFIAEELGFVGTSIVLILYSIIFILLFRILSKVKSRFGELIIIGVFAMILFQIIVNIGMNTGILPITGITLPLLSYGGSSIVSILTSLGLIASVIKFGLKKDEVIRFEL